MRIEELYQDVIIMVCNVTGIDEADILNSNREECADARYFLVMALSKMMTDEEIGRVIHRTRQGVSYIRSNRAKLSKWIVASNQQVYRKQVFHLPLNYGFLCM